MSMAKKWYVVHTYSGFENKVKKSLEERIRQHTLQDSFGEVLIPMEVVQEMVKGEKKTSKRKFFPGYILVNMEMNLETWHLVKGTAKVTGFVGNAKTPNEVPAVSDVEVQRLTTQISEGSLKPKPKVQFEEGDQVRVIDGPFSNFNGTVEEVKPDKGKVRVLVSIFGRATPVELDFMQVEKT
jgi:transcriptional antiterminator NusG